MVSEFRLEALLSSYSRFVPLLRTRNFKIRLALNYPESSDEIKSCFLGWQPPAGPSAGPQLLHRHPEEEVHGPLCLGRLGQRLRGRDPGFAQQEPPQVRPL